MSVTDSEYEHIIAVQHTEIDHLRAEIERLRAEGAGRYWEGRWRDADKEIERLKAALRYARNLIGPDEIIDAALDKS